MTSTSSLSIAQLTGTIFAATESTVAQNTTGYWLTASGGGVFSFGDAAYYGSMAGKSLAKPIVGLGQRANMKG